jgi:predicted ribosomally synthesized peptide with nif11-like leader
MSVENLKKYGQMCEEKEDVRKKAKEIGLQNLDGQIAYAKTLGLEFSKADVEALAKEAGIAGKEELSEDDLKKVAGGVVTTTAAMIATILAAAGIVAAVNSPKW